MTKQNTKALSNLLDSLEGGKFTNENAQRIQKKLEEKRLEMVESKVMKIAEGIQTHVETLRRIRAQEKQIKAQIEALKKLAEKIFNNEELTDGEEMLVRYSN